MSHYRDFATIRYPDIMDIHDTIHLDIVSLLEHQYTGVHFDVGSRVLIYLALL